MHIQLLSQTLKLIIKDQRLEYHNQPFQFLGFSMAPCLNEDIPPHRRRYNFHPEIRATHCTMHAFNEWEKDKNLLYGI